MKNFELLLFIQSYLCVAREIYLHGHQPEHLVHLLTFEVLVLGRYVLV